MGFLVGQVMKATQGRANPQTVNELLERDLRASRVDAILARHYGSRRFKA